MTADAPAGRAAAPRLAVSLLTVLPVRPVVGGDGQVVGSRRAMLWAPLVGLVLGGVAAAAMALSIELGHPDLLAATLAVGALAALTRGLHLDGLADTADGLGTSRPAADALAVMRSGDIGPFGVVALALTLLLQVAAAAEAGPLALLAGVTAGRVAMTLSCRRDVPAARPAGLGAMVAGTVPPLAAVAVAVAAVAAGTALWPLGAPAVLVGLLGGELLLRRCLRRLGGVTGDVLGAVCEVSTTVTLVVLAAG